MLTSIVLKDLPSDYDYFKFVHDYSKDKASFAKVKKAIKILKVLVTYKLRQLAMKIFLCYPKELLQKVPRVNLKTSLGSVGVAVKVDKNKKPVEYPSATFAGVLAMKTDKTRKTIF